MAWCISCSRATTPASYAAGQADTWTAIHVAMNWSSAGLTKDRRGNGYLLLWFGASHLPMADTGIWVESETETRTRVTVITLRHRHRTGPLSEEGFHQEIAKALDLVKRKQPLPLIRPE